MLWPHPHDRSKESRLARYADRPGYRHDVAVEASRSAKRRLATAQDRVKQLGGSDLESWRAALDELHQAEREVAAERGEQHAVIIDIGGAWDIGAPMPHLIAGPSSVFIVCYAREDDGNWDGTYVTMRSPSDEPAPPPQLGECRPASSSP